MEINNEIILWSTTNNNDVAEMKKENESLFKWI